MYTYLLQLFPRSLWALSEHSFQSVDSWLKQTTSKWPYECNITKHLYTLSIINDRKYCMIIKVTSTLIAYFFMHIQNHFKLHILSINIWWYLTTDTKHRLKCANEVVMRALYLLQVDVNLMVFTFIKDWKLIIASCGNIPVVIQNVLASLKHRYQWIRDRLTTRDTVIQRKSSWGWGKSRKWQEQFTWQPKQRRLTHQSYSLVDSFHH